MYVSLGSTCGIAYQLDKRFDRLAYPFDWIRTPRFVDVVKLIDTRFKDFDKIEYVKRDLDFKFDKDVQRIICKNEFCTFYHDFTSVERISIEYEKYNRRIDRLYDVICGTDKIVFIRDELKIRLIDEKYIVAVQEFNKVLKKYNLNVNYELVIIFHNPKKVVNECVDRLRSINGVRIIDDMVGFDGWERNSVNWDEVFQQDRDN